MRCWLTLTAALATLAFGADLNTIKQEPNLERRSQLALEYATASCSTAKSAYEKGGTEEWLKALQEVSDAADISREALTATGKEARRSPGPFKRAESSLRQILRRLEGLRDFVGSPDRPAVEQVRDHLSQMHDDLVTEIMAKKKK